MVNLKMKVKTKILMLTKINKYNYKINLMKNKNHKNI